MPYLLPDSLWAATATPAPAQSSLSGDIQTDIAIVGAGFTGLRAALELAQQGADVSVLDAGQAGWGASGRNGGQVNPIAHEAPEIIRRKWAAEFGDKQASVYTERFTAMYLNAADELFALVKKHNILCDAEQNGWIRAAHGPAAIPAFKKLLEGWNTAGADLEALDQTAVAKMSGATGYQLGWLAKRAGSVQPLSYARGLAEAAIAAGARLYSDTHIDHLQQVNGKWQLNSPSGIIRANQVLLCTNGYSDDLFPGLRESIVPVISIQAATQPLTTAQIAEILPGRQTFADSRRVIFYWRKTAENRLVFGSAGVADENAGPSDCKRIINGLRTVYPQFPDLKPDYLWGGRIAVTQDHLPHIHQPAPGLHAGLGYNGRGVAMATVMGRLLAELASGKAPKDMPVPVSCIKKYPFHRFHRTGIRLLVPWKEFCDRYEAKLK
ncbi:MAG: NAD(P)/FAD-dependent oxidoreductase [Thiolinea sp.]